MIDSKIGPTEHDLALFEYLTEMRKPFVVILTKADKSNAYKLTEQMQSYLGKLDTSPFVFATSSKTGFGIPELRAYLSFLLYL